jgi:hypothetical protein
VRPGLEIRGIIVIWLPSCRRLKGFAKKGATLAQNEVSQATSIRHVQTVSQKKLQY